MNDPDQRLAVARLATYCETIITHGLLPMDKEIALRALVNSTCNAFDMASVVERANAGAERRPPLPGHHMSLNQALGAPSATNPHTRDDPGHGYVADMTPTA